MPKLKFANDIYFRQQIKNVLFRGISWNARAGKLRQDDHDEDEQLNNKQQTRTFMKTSKQSIWTVKLNGSSCNWFCGDVHLDNGITGHSLASQLLGKVVQTN